jgi:UDP-GlcNAc3NAcA epimerase
MSIATVIGTRPETVDVKSKLLGIIEGVRQKYDKFAFPVIVPLHPGTWQRIIDFKLTIPQWINVIEPYGYLDFLQTEEPARRVITNRGVCMRCIVGCMSPQ